MIGSIKSLNTSYDSSSPATTPTVEMNGCPGLSTPVWMAMSRVKPEGVFCKKKMLFYCQGLLCFHCLNEKIRINGTNIIHILFLKIKLEKINDRPI